MKNAKSVKSCKKCTNVQFFTFMTNSLYRFNIERPNIKTLYYSLSHFHIDDIMKLNPISNNLEISNNINKLFNITFVLEKHIKFIYKIYAISKKVAEEVIHRNLIGYIVA